MNVVLASTSKRYGEEYLAYLTPQITALFQGVNTVTFVPFARPGGISHADYTAKAKTYFDKIGKRIVALDEYKDKESAIKNAEAIFTGGGNTFLLVKQLHELNLMALLANNISSGTPYLGCSAGTNIAGINMKTTNDMPIVYPPSFDCMGLVPFNINPHYLDPIPNLKHNGETRETRIQEFLTQNNVKVVGLREGNWIRKIGNCTTVEGSQLTRIFEVDKAPYELKPGNSL